MSKTFVIGEMGSTHMGKYSWMEDLIQIARDAGCDAVKGQWCSNVDRLCARRNAWNYRDAYRLINFSPHWLEGLAKETERRGLQFMCTCYIPEDVPIIAPYVAAFKVASFENQSHDLLEAIQEEARFGGPAHRDTYISLGLTQMADLGNLPEFGWARYLHCTSAYPTPLDEMNLAVLQDPRISGLSDHSRCEDLGAYAVMAGATVIEAHVTHPHCQKTNPDYAVSFYPNRFGNYVSKIRLAEKIYGDGVKKVQPCEQSYLQYRVKA